MAVGGDAGQRSALRSATQLQYHPGPERALPGQWRAALAEPGQLFPGAGADPGDGCPGRRLRHPCGRPEAFHRRALRPPGAVLGRRAARAGPAAPVGGASVELGGRRPGGLHPQGSARAPRRRTLESGRPRQRTQLPLPAIADHLAAPRPSGAGPAGTAGVLRLRPVQPAGADPRTRRAAAARVGLHGVRHRDHRSGALRGRRDHLDRRGAHRQRAPAQAGVLRAVGRSAPVDTARLAAGARAVAADARRAADYRARLATVPALRRGYGAGRAQRRLRHAFPPAQGGADRDPLHPTGARHPAAVGPGASRACAR
ncbi:hypothetical protein D3C81_1167630 [compost metagenome]